LSIHDFACSFDKVICRVSGFIAAGGGDCGFVGGVACAIASAVPTIRPTPASECTIV
jgi:hypothetical protein